MKEFRFSRAMDPQIWSATSVRLTTRDPGSRNTNAPHGASYAGRQARLRSGGSGTERPAILMPRALADNLPIAIPPEPRKVCAVVSLPLRKAPHGLAPGSDGGRDEIRAPFHLPTTRSPTREVAADAPGAPNRGDRKGIRGVAMPKGTGAQDG